MQAQGRRTFWHSLPITILILSYFAVRSFYFDNLSVFDARPYYKLFILDQQAKPFDILNYSGDHNGQAWFFLAGISNLFFPASYYAYNVWIAILGVTGVLAFHLILGELAGNRLTRAEHCLLTAIYAFHPSILACQIHTTLDIGLSLFWLWYLYFLLRGNKALASLFGCCLLFTKESALLHLPIVYLFCMLLKPPEARKPWALSNRVAIALPYTLMALFLLYKAVIRHQKLFYHGFLQQHDPIYVVYIAPDASLVNYVFMALILNFDWIFTSLGAVLTFLPASYCAQQDCKKNLPAYAWLFFSTLFVVLAVRQGSSIRYVLPLFPVIILYCAYALAVIPQQKARLTILLSLLILLGWENVRTIDPVSKAVFCNTPFGKHEILYIPYLEVCAFTPNKKRGLARDQLFYNLEANKIPMLATQMIRDTHPNNNTAFIMEATWAANFFTGLDADARPTFAKPAITPRFFQNAPTLTLLPKFAAGLPDDLYYIEVPLLENGMFRKFFSQHYRKKEERLYDSDGYQMTLVHYSGKINPPFTK